MSMTWKELGQAIVDMTEEQRQQPVQVVELEPSDDIVNELKPAYGIQSIEELGIEACRSIVDNKRHGEDVVLLIDANPFAEDGAVAYEWPLGDVQAPAVPIYGKDGPTNPADQRIQR